MSVVIVGAGQAGFQVAASLRSEGYGEAITLIGEEPYLPYQRPPLSKGFLSGKQQIESAVLRPEEFYSDHGITLIPGERVVAIDRAGRQVRLAGGTRVGYDSLVLATGARVRKLPVEDALYLRDWNDALELKQRLEGAESVLVIGGGFIGLEVAAAARTLGKSVKVLEAQPRLMARCVAPAVSEFYRQVHQDEGVEVITGVADLAPYAADLVVAGVGVIPNAELALEAGLRAGNGIAVDEQLRTSDERIFAIGDCAEHPNPFAEAPTRLESVQNAVDQAKCVAANIAGRREAYRAVPWFWTDQFDAKLQMAGLSGGADQTVTRGEPQSRKFSVFYFKRGRLIAVDSINRPGDHLAARKILGAGMSVSPAEAADLSFDLKIAK